MRSAAQKNGPVTEAKPTKHIREKWLAEGPPIQPRDENVLVVKLTSADFTGGSSLAIVTSLGVEEGGSQEHWHGCIYQVIAIGPGEFNQHTGGRVPIEGLKPGDYVASANDFGGVVLPKFEGVHAVVMPHESMRCVVDVPGKP